MAYKKTLAIDFDGVIHKYSKGWQNGEIYDEPMEHVGPALAILQKHYNIVIFTARDNLYDVREWLQIHLPYLGDIEITNVKPKAFLYIDDRGYRFDSWANTLMAISRYDDNSWISLTEDKDGSKVA